MKEVPGVTDAIVKDFSSNRGSVYICGFYISGVSVKTVRASSSMVRKSGTFAITVLDDSCTYETIERFGMHSGRDMEKFSGLDFAVDENPYLKNLACAVLSCRVVSFQDLGTHSMFARFVVIRQKILNQYMRSS